MVLPLHLAKMPFSPAPQRRVVRSSLELVACLRPLEQAEGNEPEPTAETHNASTVGSPDVTVVGQLHEMRHVEHCDVDSTLGQVSKNGLRAQSVLARCTGCRCLQSLSRPNCHSFSLNSACWSELKTSYRRIHGGGR